MFVHLCSSLFIDGRFLFQLHGLEGCGNRQPDLARFGNFCNFSRLKLVNLLSRLGDRFLRIAWYDMVCTCMILYDTNLLSCTSPAPLLHPSCTSPDPCCASLPCTSPAEVRRLSGRHFKPFQNKCEAMQSFYVLLYKAIRCGYVLGLHGTSPDLSCTSPDLSCTPPASLLTPAAPLFPAPLQEKLEGFPKDTSNHFKTNAKLCKAFLCFYIELSDVITCWACMAPLLTSPAPLLTSCTPPDPCCTFLCCTSPAEVRRRSF